VGVRQPSSPGRDHYSLVLSVDFISHGLPAQLPFSQVPYHSYCTVPESLPGLVFFDIDDSIEDRMCCCNNCGIDSTSADDPGPQEGSVQSSPLGRSNWTDPQTGTLGLDRRGLDRSIYTCNFAIAVQPSTTENMTHRHFITSHHRIPTKIEIMPLFPIDSAPSRYVISIKKLITGEVYPNPRHGQGSVQTNPSPVCQHLGSV
jgi:hypothetical protein